MNATRTAELAAEPSRTARVAGAAFLFFTIASVLHYALVEVHLLVSENLEDVAHFIESSEQVFKLGIVLDLVLFVSGLILSVSLYALTRETNEGVAPFALICMVMETVISVVVELTSFVAWMLVESDLPQAQSATLLAIALGVRASGYVLAILFFSLGMGLFSHLLLRASRIPSAIGAIGVLSFSAMVAATLVHIGAPALSIAASSSETVGQGASVIAMLFQVALGAWLLLKSKPQDETIRLRG